MEQVDGVVVASKFNPDVDEFISLYEELKSSRKMGEYYGVDKSTILNFSKKIGYKREAEKLLSDEDIEFIVDNYENYTSNELAEMFNCSKSRITQIWRNNGLKGKQPLLYHANFDYFNKIDSKDKAYFLGFISADGNVWKRDRKNSQGQLRISIHSKDVDVLHKFKKYINSNHKITEFSFVHKDTGTITETSSLTIVSDKIFNDLSKYNITPNKTWKFHPINIPDNFISHFIRGYFDGDGSITKSSAGYYTVKIVGNQKTTKYISNFLKENYIYHILIEDKRKYIGGKLYSINISTIDGVKNFYNIIYKDCDDLYMDRKKDRFEEFIDIFFRK